jgi:PEP-CTERM motif
MLKRSFLLSALVFGVSLLWAGGARADTTGSLSLIGCGGGDLGCPDATYTFDITNTSATLTIHIDGTVGAANYISAVNLGFTNSSNISGLSGTGPSQGGTWSTGTGSINNTGCGGNNGAFIYSCSTAPGVLIHQGDTLIWNWTYGALTDSQIADANSVHVGANYDPPNGLIVSQTGTGTTQVPEPNTASLLLVGLLGLAGTARRLLHT